MTLDETYDFLMQIRRKEIIISVALHPEGVDRNIDCARFK